MRVEKKDDNYQKNDEEGEEGAKKDDWQGQGQGHLNPCKVSVQEKLLIKLSNYIFSQS